VKIKICAFCGVEFMPNNGKQKCCSRNCNVKLWRKNNPEKVKASEKKQNEKRKGINRYNPEVRKEWYNNKRKDKSWVEKIQEQERKRNLKVKNFMARYKILKGCADCGYKKHHVVLDFDHVKGEKEINLAFAKSIEQAKKEIRKCEVVCSNCHRIRTYNRLHESKK